MGNIEFNQIFFAFHLRALHRKRLVAELPGHPDQALPRTVVTMPESRSSTIRGSRLSMEDKKHVLAESGAERTELEMKKVSAHIRMLGSSFFPNNTLQESGTGPSRPTTTTFGVEEMEGYSKETWDEEAKDSLEALAAEDDDASLVLQFENAAPAAWEERSWQGSESPKDSLTASPHRPVDFVDKLVTGRPDVLLGDVEPEVSEGPLSAPTGNMPCQV